ncbi:hypothetical protein [Streptomyces sp. NPDC020983]|uniref:hypothetical protein n=1 Tax=Streptomyces sp. NPDC020983 TaxID=3365106 RepID=UPI0037922BBE
MGVGGRGVGRRGLLAGAVAGVTGLAVAPARAADTVGVRQYASGRHTVLARPLANEDGSNPLVQIRDVNRPGQVLGMLDAGEGATPRWPSAIWAEGRVTVLPPPVEDAADCGATRLNDGGQAAGYYTVGGREHATLWTGGVPRVLDIGTAHSRAFALNNAGQVGVRGYDQPSGDTATWNTVCLVDGTTVTTVEALSGKGLSVVDVNDRGEVLVGTFVPQGGPGGAFLWRDGAVVADFSNVDGDPGFLGFQGVAGLNVCGDVVGNYYSPLGAPNPRVFRWSNGTLTTVTGPDGSGIWVADGLVRQALNDCGDFVGFVNGPAGNRPFLWSSGTFTDLGSLGGLVAYPVDVNNARQVVGASQHTDGSSGAFLWRAGELIDLTPPPGFDGISVDAVTEQGDVLGSAWRTGSARVYFRFTVL